MNKTYKVVAKAIKRQWDVQVSITGTGEKSLAIHETAARIAHYISLVDFEFNQDEFMKACGVTYEG